MNEHEINKGFTMSKDSPTVSIGFCKGVQTNNTNGEKQDIWIAVSLDQYAQKVYLAKVTAGTTVHRTENNQYKVKGLFRIWFADYKSGADPAKVAEALKGFEGGAPEFWKSAKGSKAWSIVGDKVTIDATYGDRNNTIETLYTDVLEAIATGTIYLTAESLEDKLCKLVPKRNIWYQKTVGDKILIWAIIGLATVLAAAIVWDVLTLLHDYSHTV